MKRSKKHSSKFRYNLRPGMFLLIVPIILGIGALSFLFSSAYGSYLAAAGAQRIASSNWDDAAKLMESEQPTYQRQFAYYKVLDGQTLPQLADFFGVDATKLAQMNPGTIVAGTTIKVTPVEKPLTPFGAPNGLINTARVSVADNIIHVRQLFKSAQIRTTIPELMNFLGSYGAIQQIAPKVYRINKAISLDDNIRLDITNDTVTKLELRSSPNDITCLCLDGGMALIDNVDVTSIDPATNQPDTNPDDQRSFIRALSARMDIINSRISYLGNGLMKVPDDKKPAIQKQGGVYGISWRIPDGAYGSQIATGWVENNVFYKNHFGSFTFGASGMTWKNNYYLQNDIYGLDPHDDSNNALIEDNVFERNGKHGFIVSKRCRYNIIRNNTSIDNKLHGFMLHQDSAYNVIEDNVSYGNADNFAIFASDFNTIRNNKSYAPRLSHIRVNEKSQNTFLTGNQLYGGNRGIYLYGKVNNVFISGNTIEGPDQPLATNGAQHVLLAGNTLGNLHAHLTTGDQVLFGTNTINTQTPVIPATAPLPTGFTPKNTQF